MCSRRLTLPDFFVSQLMSLSASQSKIWCLGRREIGTHTIVLSPIETLSLWPESQNSGIEAFICELPGCIWTAPEKCLFMWDAGYCELVVILCTCLANDCMLKSPGSTCFSLVPNGSSSFLMQHQGLPMALLCSVWDTNTFCISSRIPLISLSLPLCSPWIFLPHFKQPEVNYYQLNIEK